MTGLRHHLATPDRLGELEPIGVVDIGSNSVRLVIYDGLTRAPTPVFNEKVLCGLGRSIASSGKLDTEGVSRALRPPRAPSAAPAGRGPALPG